MKTRPTIQKLILLLAGSGWDEQSIYELLREVDRIGPGPITEEVHELRRRLPKLNYLHEDGSDNAAIRKRKQQREVAERVSELLRKEARLQSPEAAYRLRHSLGKIANVKLPSFDAKKGFDFWILKLAEIIDPSTLLHHATKIRSEQIHKGTSDWPLKG